LKRLDSINWHPSWPGQTLLLFLLLESNSPDFPTEFQDIQVMIFIGFGFLMTFLRKYGYSATGFTLFMAALVVQWAVLMKGFLHMEDGKIR